MPEPRFWNQGQVCARLGMGEETFRKRRVYLERRGFPPKNADFNGWDSVAVERYLDRQSGLINDVPSVDYRGAGDGL